MPSSRPCIVRNKHDFQAAATQAGDESDFETELSILRDVFRLLPAGVTVQDEHGEFLLVNDAAAALLQMAAAAPVASPLSDRRETCLELLRSGRAAVLEEASPAARPSRCSSPRTGRSRSPGAICCSRVPPTSPNRRRSRTTLFRSAYYDELTGLPTRRVIEHRVNSLLQRDDGQGRFALAFLDIDNFKHINDYYGHAVGDALLVEMSKRLGMDLRDSDMLSRISGDEFVLLLNPIQSEAEVAEYIDFILQRLKAPFFIDGSEIFASTSIGVSLYPEHGRSYDVLRQNADIAMYRVKNGGKGAAAFFDASMEREALARMKIEQSLRLAILEKRFCCAFQPKVDIRTQEVKGIEALVRLRDDEGVIQAPGTFINLAVELGPDRRADPSGAGGDRQVDRPDQRDLRPRHHDQHQRRGQAGRQSRIHAAVRAGARSDRISEALHDRGDGRRLRHQDAFPGRDPADLPQARRRDLDRRFRHRLFVAVGAGRHHRRRDQDRPFLHHRHP